MNKKVYIGPETNLIEAIRRRTKFRLHVLLAEAIDNSIDAGSTRIDITVNDAEIEIEDNGIGVSNDRWEKLVRYGGHGPTGRTVIGQFGIGIKDQSIAAGDWFRVNSVSEKDGQEIKLLVNWARISADKAWEMDPPTWRKPTRDRGTIITISALRPKITSKDIDYARAEIATMFYPALIGGKKITPDGGPVRITVNQQQILPFSDPQYTEDELPVLVTSFELPEGRRVWVRAGILADPSSKMHGVQLSFKHRVIEKRCALGCVGYATSGFFARIMLSGNWGLSSLKDALLDEYEEALGEDISSLLQPYLERCRHRSASSELDDINRQLNEMLPAEERARPRRKVVYDPPRQGPKRGLKGHDKVVVDSIPSKSGPVRNVSMNNKSLHEIRVQPWDDRFGLGQFLEGKPNRTIVNKDSPVIQSILARKDRASMIEDLFLIARVIQRTSKKQLDFAFEGGEGGIAKLLEGDLLVRFSHLSSQKAA